MFWKLCRCVGVVSFLHAAFSAAQLGSYRRVVTPEASESFAIGATSAPLVSATSNAGVAVLSRLPIDIVVQALASMLLILVSIVATSGTLLEIRTLDEFNRKPRSTFDNLPSFYRFSHRGRILLRNTRDCSTETLEEDFFDDGYEYEFYEDDEEEEEGGGSNDEVD